MTVAALSLVASISASITLATTDDWWRIALSRLSLEPYGYIFSLGFVITAVCLGMALYLQLRTLGSHWASDAWRLHTLRWLFFGLCLGLGLIGLFPDGEPYLTWHRLGGWLCVITATLLSLGAPIWMPHYHMTFKRFSLVVGAVPYGTLAGFVMGIITYTLLELFLLVLGGIWISVFYGYTRVATGQAPAEILETSGI